MCRWTCALLTLMVHARTSSGPAVKKYSSCKAAYPVLMILVRILKKKIHNVKNFKGRIMISLLLRLTMTIWLNLEHQFSTVQNSFCMWKNKNFLKLSKEQILTSVFCFPRNISVSLHQSYPDNGTQIPHWTGWPAHLDHEHQPTPWSSPTYKRKDSKCFTSGLPNSNHQGTPVLHRGNCCSTNVLTTMNLDYIVTC